MREAKRRAKRDLELDATGTPRPRDNWCPACWSLQIKSIAPGELRTSGFVNECEWQVCVTCKAVWEAFPPVYARDPVCAEPCDNCAFRPGSPEQQDPEKWKKLMAELRPSESPDNIGMFVGQFFCHKGMPIDMTHGPGNFLFPEKPVTMNGEPLIDQDGTPVMMKDTRRMRTCSGFLRMIWSLNDKTKKIAGQAA